MKLFSKNVSNHLALRSCFVSNPRISLPPLKTIIAPEKYTTLAAPAMLHCLKNPEWLPGGPKIAEMVWNGVYPKDFGRSPQLSLNRFLEAIASLEVMFSVTQSFTHVFSNFMILSI